MENNESSFNGLEFARSILGNKPIPQPEVPKVETPAEAVKQTIDTPLMKVEVKSDNSFLTKLSSETGFSFEKEEDVVETLKKYKEFNSKEEEYLKTNKLGSEYITFFNTLPDDLKKIIVDYGQNADYKSTIKDIYGFGEVDYNKAWNEYNDEFAMVKRYNSDLTQDDWDEMDEKAQRLVKNTAKRSYETERNSFLENNRRQAKEFEIEMDRRTKRYVESVEESVSQLEKELPDMDKRKIAEVKNKMLSNPFSNMFNEDGTYKKEAATQIAFSYYGQETMQQVINRMNQEANENVQKAVKDASQGRLEEYVQRANDKVPSSDGREDKDLLLENIKATTRGLFSNPGLGFKNKQTL